MPFGGRAGPAGRLDTLPGGAPVSTVLLVDDDADIRAMLRMGLEDEGYRVVEAGDAETALYGYAHHAVDVALVDIRLPGMSGLDLCREMRRRSRGPIVAVTAQASAADIEAGFEAGVDDYVTKPVELRALVRRMRALEERVASQQDEPHTIEAGALRIRLPEGEVTWAGKVLELSAIELAILVVLVDPPGRAVPREQLFERVWGPDRLDDLRMVDHAVERLQSHLVSAPDDQPAIILLPEGGYRLSS